MKKAFIFACVCFFVVFSLSFYKENDIKTAKTNLNFAVTTQKALELSFDEILIKNSEKSAHSSSLLRFKEGILLVFFAGTKEGAKDVRIYKSFLNAGKFDEPKAILSAKDLSLMSKKFIKKLGNPVLFKDTNERVHLFVVGVSLGGWATSKIYQLRFDESLEKLEFIGELKLSNLANFSHLVRTPALALQNSGFVLPFYHELADKYALLGYFDDKARLKFTQRLNSLKSQLQPSMIATNSNSCLIFFRNHKAYENDAFMQSCENPEQIIKTNLKSYDTSSVLFSFDFEGKKRILLVHNDAGKKMPRKSLSLYYLTNLENLTNEAHFTKLFTIKEADEVSYPSVSLDEKNAYLSFTLDRKNILFKRFSLESLNSLIEKLEQGVR
ncbi:hypothetical protein DMB92_02035 [Campylobacter sp. MIT 99-7217]|uniref:sialidase family protein n=1 Tax=Campylobacter sp. MIT 99-7217 TaxID=535091 RepID=UPI00115BBCC4|nr:sialidase family protein [Campylobacter sp. MIT 99-7217]TQR33689.1 hypothetical protein DMB92_02035 [Campylobacter sp. MIT 99-7217]